MQVIDPVPTPTNTRPTRNRRAHIAALLLLGWMATLPASATTQSVVGSLDPSNANDVFLDTFTLASPSDLIIQSYGYGGSSGAPGGTNAAGTVIAAGGFDTYFSLFEGSGASATFLASNDDGGCGPATPDPVCEDSRLSFANLAAGTYVLALTLPENYSIAENYGAGTLGDGFIGLQGDYYDEASDTVRTSAYAFDLTSTPTSTPPPPPPTVTPEPSALLLLGTGMIGLYGVRRRLPAARG